MLIRKASAFDFPFILDMLREYRNHTPMQFLASIDDAAYIEKMLYEIIAGKGILLVAVNHEGICGMLIAGINPSLWSPQNYLMHEYAFWVNPDARLSTAAYRLLSEYVAYGNALIVEGRISNFFISKMANSPDLKYGKLGFQKLEEFWGI